MSTHKRRRFPENVKRQAVERMASRGLPIVRVDAELGLHETLSRRWMKQFGETGTGPARRPARQAQAPSTADLVAENARLKRDLA